MDLTHLFEIILIVIGVVTVYYWYRNQKRYAQQVTPAAANDEYKLDRSPELARAAKNRVFGDQDPERVERMFDQFCFLFAQAGTFATKPEPAVVQQLVRSVFPSEHHESVLATLERYGKRKHEQEKGRIQLDIIKASGGDHAKVKELVKLAKRDFRDLVIMAESPISFKTHFDSSTHEDRKAQDADLRQFGIWLLQYVK